MKEIEVISGLVQKDIGVEVRQEADEQRVA